MMLICHLTSAHPRYDIRIFYKQCRSLAREGYDVTLVVADGDRDETRDGIRILEAERSSGGRLSRILRATRTVGRAGVKTGATVFHLHDPELMPIGLKLKRKGFTVIFDAHEDLPRQILSKPYLHPFLRTVIASVMARYERYVCRKFDGVVAATPFIRDKFLKINPNTVDVNNYPKLDELSLPSGSPPSPRKKQVCYVGGITEIRGIKDLVTAMEHLNSGARLAIGGCFSDAKFRNRVTAIPGWNRVDDLGWLDRGAVRNLLHSSVAGVVTFRPVPNHIDAQPNKMFEYMSAGIPVIASHFPLWREIVEGNECGICVDPQNPREIAAAIDYLVSHPDEAQRMGANGRRAVEERYNWNVEEKKLLALYRELTADKGTIS